MIEIEKVKNRMAKEEGLMVVAEALLDGCTTSTASKFSARATSDTFGANQNYDEVEAIMHWLQCYG